MVNPSTGPERASVATHALQNWIQTMKKLKFGRDECSLAIMLLEKKGTGKREIHRTSENKSLHFIVSTKRRKGIYARGGLVRSMFNPKRKSFLT